MNVYPHSKQASSHPPSPTHKHTPTHTSTLCYGTLHRWRLEEDKGRKNADCGAFSSEASAIAAVTSHSLPCQQHCHWVFAAAGAALWVCQSTAERADGRTPDSEMLLATPTRTFVQKKNPRMEENAGEDGDSMLK